MILLVVLDHIQANLFCYIKKISLLMEVFFVSSDGAFIATQVA